MRQTQWAPPSQILNYDILNDYRWVSDFNRLAEVEKELTQLRRERDRIATLPLKKSDYFARIKESHDRIEERRRAGLVAILQEYREYDDPLRFFQQRLRDPFSHWLDPIPSLNELKKAVDALLEGEISAKDREKQLAAFEKKIVSLDSKLKELRSHETVKMAKVFVAKWRHLQRQINSECNPFGIDLNQCARREKAAWNDLNMGKYLSKTAPFLAHPGPKKGFQDLKNTGIRLSRAKDEKPGQGYMAANG